MIESMVDGMDYGSELDTIAAAAAEMAELGLWEPHVYEALMLLESGEMSQEEFRDRYGHRVAILVMDMSGLTETTVTRGELHALLKVLAMQRICAPVLRDNGATLVRAFADDIVALFADPVDAFRAAELVCAASASIPGVSMCAGIGFGDVLAIGPNNAMGDEMNRASKLGEDIAEPDEILLTAKAHEAISGVVDGSFELIVGAKFSYFRTVR